MINRICTVLFFLLGSTIVGLQAQDTPRLLLAGQTYTLETGNAYTGVAALKAEKAPLVHRLVQFTRPLTYAEQKILQTEVGGIVEYIPENAYVMSIPGHADFEALNSLPLHAIIPMTAEMKMTKRMFNGDIPEYARRGDNRMEAVMVVYPEHNPKTIRDVMFTLGIDIISYDEDHLKYILEMPIGSKRTVAALPFVRYLQEGEDPGEPENFNGRTSHRSRAIDPYHSGGIHYDGSGVVLGHGDDGDIGPHIDFTGRIIARKTGASNGTHGDHVAGTVLGAGNLDPSARGMARGADLVYYQYPRNLNEVDNDFNTYGVRITVSSYSNGCNAGYTSFSQQMDQDINDQPTLMHVFSAGNNGTSNCGYGAGSGWGNVTGGHKVGKNVITAANVTSADNLASSSSRGPAADGRIKPDVAAVGTNVFSTLNDNLYGYKTGTSMACPGVAGSMAQLVHAFKSTQGYEPDGGLTKAIMMNSAEDLGNPGPDFKFGYGRINNLRALEAIENSQFFTDSLTTGQSDLFNISVPSGVAELRVMVYWSDQAASTLASRALVNNLDASLATPSNGTLLPWVLNPTPNATLLNQNAQRAVDSLNNAEQITLGQPASGNYVLTVNGTNIPMGNQKYFVVYHFVFDGVELTYPMGGEALVTGETVTISWDASPGTGSFVLDYSLDNGSTWNTIGTAPANDQFLNWSTSGINNDSVVLRITRGSDIDYTNSPVLVMPQPSALNVNKACPFAFDVNWRSAANASGYVVYALGNKYMDSIGFTTDTFYSFTGYPPNGDVWFSVAAVAPNGRLGMRANAVLRSPGLLNCLLVTDVKAYSITNPTSGVISTCHDLSSIPVKLNITNTAIEPIDTVPLAYRLNGGTIVRNTSYVTLQPKQSAPFTFSQSATANLPGRYEMKIWIDLPGDQNPYNDTTRAEWTVKANSAIATAPYTEDFEWVDCDDSPDCESIHCALADDWLNIPNDTIDDIDWITNSGGTASANTGPASDHTFGTSAGSYLYLEASGSCSFRQAHLNSPCIDLSGMQMPELRFWWHLYGADIGELHVDIFSDGEWTQDVMPVLSGNQGNQWQETRIGLLPWKGKVITVRFRGSTGADYRGDMSIDDFSIVESTTKPSVDFAISDIEPCIGKTVQLTDKSINVPTDWDWVVTPGTFSFVNGTSDTSQHPEVVFNAVGTYTVKLLASNAIGLDSSFQTNVINVHKGTGFAVADNFQQANSNWTVVNPDSFRTWENAYAIGPDGITSIAKRINNFQYNAAGENDFLVSPRIDLTGKIQPYFSFDVSYSGKPGNADDRLRIEVSGDCGLTWTSTSYDKTDTSLATASPVSHLFAPSPTQWRRDSLDLSPWIGQSIYLRLRHTTAHGNVLYIDNTNIYDASVTPPVAQAVFPNADSCIGYAFVFEYTGLHQPYMFWDFGSTASPATASGPGPHAVYFNTPGPKTVTFEIRNSGGRDIQTIHFNTYSEPLADYTYSQNPNLPMDYAFTFTGSNDALSYKWYFDDQGASDSVPNPTHTFSTTGVYEVSVLIQNEKCGYDIRVQYIHVTGVDISESKLDDWILSPVPADHYLRLHSREHRALSLNEIEIIDPLGRVLQEIRIDASDAEVVVDVSSLSPGIYFVRTEGKYRRILKFVVE